ncbi:MAG: EamA family transporter [Lentisphaeria bacterium]|nr:EamA family transporter [Lentisphaeria bacterium]
MFAGFVIALVSAVFQSVGFVFSRAFIIRHRDPVKLTIYSQVWMAVIGVVILAAIRPWQTVEFTPRVLGILALFSTSGNLSYICFFQAMKLIEASRLSSLLGMKMVTLAVLNIIVFRDFPTAWKWAAIVLSSAAAVGMNFSGGRLPLLGCLMLFITLCGYAVNDTLLHMLVGKIPGPSLTTRALAATALNFGALGVVSSLVFVRMKFEMALLKSAFSYGACWMLAMVGLVASLHLLGVMLGSIVQASRGFFSVLIGYALLKCGRSDLEPSAPPRMWVRRGVMAMLIVLAMVLYVHK